ncbi:MAG: PSD1 and planctomycete cytochrome C domain-containing protein [Planctomycetota bacterium]
MSDDRRHARSAAAVLATLIVGTSVPATATDAPPATGQIRFSEHVRPILSDRCYLCHGPDSSTRQADLRLDTREMAIADRGGYAAIVPGDHAASELWKRVTHPNHGDRMPPPKAGEPALTQAERDILRTWIDGGAEYERHWSYVAPVRPDVPAVADDTWPRNDIDRFLLARLEREDVAPSDEADATSLVRRLFIELTGLPPTPEEVDAFLADGRDDLDAAYERWVDRLLTEEPYASRFAENWAAPWLDAARYADTCGIHMDAGRQMWLWRDWVLGALRENKPYDTFIEEQLAGDLLSDASVDQKIASGFNRNHVTTDEGGAISEEYLIEYAADRVNTTSAVFLGLTTGCARCHDHKYDPISQEDFYRFLAFFRSIEEPGLYSQQRDTQRALEPFITVPTDEQRAMLTQMDSVGPEDETERAEFVRAAREWTGAAWVRPDVVAAASSDAGVTLSIEEDGEVQASGPIPATEDYTIDMTTDRGGFRLFMLEALPTPGKGPGAGRAGHGNIVVTKLDLLVRPAGSDDEGAWTSVPMRWAWSDHQQMNGDFGPTNLIDRLGEGWTSDGNANAGRRVLCMLAEETFGFDGGTDARLRLEFRSRYQQHSAGRVRVRLGSITEQGLAALPPALGRWYLAGHFASEDRDAVFDLEHGPETVTTIDPDAEFENGAMFRFNAALPDAKTARLAGGVGSNYLGRVVYSPDARSMTVSLGSDDGYRLFVNGREVAAERVNRGVAPDQSTASFDLQPGRNSLVLKVVNTGGPSGFYFRDVPPESGLGHDLVAALFPEDALGPKQMEAFVATWRRSASPSYRAAETELAETQTARNELAAAVPRTMVMKELETPRETYVLMRGQYDHPDKERPVTPGIPVALGALADDAPPDRLGLARWITSDENPLAARVAVNRVWQTIFGTGLVRTSEDFGMQGEWPSHPELLDWLAVDFRESGWDLHRLIRMILTSSAYRQRSVIRPELAEIDPDNRLLAHYPRRRLTAEQIRDQALYISGLLMEQFGGRSVKPYQPEGLWREVAMPQSNTRIFQRGETPELWRRSMYTYWKRASPPPSLLTFDAPTRESCLIRRMSTNTPLQALVLWNDEQYVEAARLLAQRTLATSEDDALRMTSLYRRCTGRPPASEDLAELLEALAHFRARYAASPDDAAALLAVGEAGRDESIDAAELAAWTVISNAMLSLHETITQD